MYFENKENDFRKTEFKKRCADKVVKVCESKQILTLQNNNMIRECMVFYYYVMKYHKFRVLKPHMCYPKSLRLTSLGTA